MAVIRHGEESRCMECGGELDAVAHNADGESRFAFVVTHRKDGTPIKNLEGKGGFLGTIEATKCRTCSTEQALIDSLDGEPEEWSELPKWHDEH